MASAWCNLHECTLAIMIMITIAAATMTIIGTTIAAAMGPAQSGDKINN